MWYSAGSLYCDWLHSLMCGLSCCPGLYRGKSLEHCILLLGYWGNTGRGAGGNLWFQLVPFFLCWFPAAFCTVNTTCAFKHTYCVNLCEENCRWSQMLAYLIISSNGWRISSSWPWLYAVGAVAMDLLPISHEFLFISAWSLEHT